MTRNRITVFAASGDCIISITGSAETDEMEVSAVLDAVLGALWQATHSKPLSEKGVIQYYTKVCLVLDGAATSGVVDTWDVESLRKTMKLHE